MGFVLVLDQHQRVISVKGTVNLTVRDAGVSLDAYKLWVQIAHRAFHPDASLALVTP